MIDISVEDKSVINIVAGDVNLSLTHGEARKLLELLSRTLNKSPLSQTLKDYVEKTSIPHLGCPMPWCGSNDTVYLQASDVI